MRNVIILGSGRSGTSLTAGMLAGNGYYMGGKLSPGDASNPAGYFESQEINRINEVLLSQATPRARSGIAASIFGRGYRDGQRWLAALPPGARIKTPASLVPSMRLQCMNEPHCFKDPRFSYTLECWRPYLRAPVYICVFREPGRTAESMVRFCEEHPYLRELKLTYGHGLRVWAAMYRRILQSARQGQWVFVHYRQLLEGSGVRRIARATEAAVNREFSEPAFSRTQTPGAVPGELRGLYEELCRLAGWEGERAREQAGELQTS